MSTPQGTEASANPLGILASIASPVARDQQQPAADGLKTPRPSDDSHDSLSPPHSPSTRAAMRRTRRDTSDSRPQTAQPGAIPATQLDVLALVTATSPPMPSRRRWAGHSTPKPAFQHSNQTPARATRSQISNGNSKHDSGSDTVSEDEQTLRSYSSRARARYQTVRMRPLPTDVRAPSTAPRARNPRNYSVESDGDTTETDEEMPFTRTPVSRRTGQAGNSLTLEPQQAFPRMPPASEPTLRRRSRRRLHAGTNLSHQLSQLEETDEMESGSAITASQQQPRRIHVQHSGSETETDGEFIEQNSGSAEPEPNGFGIGGRVSVAGRTRATPFRTQMSQTNGHSRTRQSSGDLSSGETTETDEEFFGPIKAVHSSIRPPRRVVRHLASLRASQPRQQPAALDLSEYAYSYSQQTRTAPVSANSTANADSTFGLGISSEAPVLGGATRGPSRILSTPSMAASAALPSAVRGTGPLPPPANYLHEAPMPQGNTRKDPFGPPDDFTFRGAALRRLERSGGMDAGSGNRKRALTAPSSYDAARSRRAPSMLGAKTLTDSLLEDDREDSASGYHTPPERSRQLGNRNGLLGESPVSSLRSSLLTRAGTQSSQASTSHGQAPGMASGPGSPSMDAALRQGRKRRRSPSQQSPLAHMSDASSVSPTSRRRTEGSPKDDESSMFPPI
ncbi:hypothetical protein LPJ55_000168 [Coemansia sp. RSA 990]|nr:hypothetical protein LPJ79_001952 [Coemansia sp. RSA 1821]KAJ1875988.1 hypothetical protein LPJ55_000168 [Coemansia sp. RSA 990]KAJ2674111.1 hypothetical protein IWW42_001931 [Coemansia sp. RSA 1085]